MFFVLFNIYMCVCVLFGCGWSFAKLVGKESAATPAFICRDLGARQVPLSQKHISP